MSNLNFEQSKHLIIRTGYGPELEKIYLYQNTSMQQSIKSLLARPRDYLIHLPELTSFIVFRELRRSKNKRKFNQLFSSDVKKLKQWGLQQALSNPNALQEKMTWFWHNHFTSSYFKSRRTLDLVLNQDLLIRKNAMGNFADLLHDMAHDPLMLIYLDGIANVKGKPNENFARELLEIFTLGEGYYEENDIKGIARAFAGWGINGKTQQARLRIKHADNGIKKIFNQTGKFSSNDALNLILNNPRTAEFIAEKFWKEFINLDLPNPATIKSWAKQFRDSNYEITALLRVVLESPDFWSTNNRAKLIKSPLDLVIGTLRTLDLEDKSLPLNSVSVQLKRMGQDIYNPPNVKGWIGGEYWIDDVTLPVRQLFLRRISRGSNNQQKPAKGMMMKKNVMPRPEVPRMPVDLWGNWLLQMPSITPTEQKSPHKRLQSILLDPTYQLK